MGQTLTNGIYLPAEGERNCYEGLAANWTALDGLIGGYNVHISNTTIHVTAEDKQAWNGKADASALTAHTGDTTIHVTAEDKQAWNGKADASALTAHTGDTTIHVTAEDKATWNGKADASALTAHTGDTTIHVTAADKQAWNGHVADTTIHVTSADKQAWNGHVADSVKHVTAEDKAKWDAVTSKANDSNVVHKSGNETISGDKVFNNRLIKNIDVVLGTAPSTTKFSTVEITDNNKSTLLQVMGGVYANGQSYARFAIQNKMADDGTGLSPTGTLRGCGFNINLPASSTSDGQGSITPRANKATDFGLSGYQWRNLWCEKLYLNGTRLDPSAFVTTDTAQTISGNKTFSSINGVEPSSLSLPNLSAGVDISGYITNLNKGVNTYTPPANGWINIRIRKTSLIHTSLMIYQTDGLLSSCEADEYNISGTNLPVIANQNVDIYIYADALVEAKFYPCQGNL